jgi:hypothetical protein
MRYVKKYSLCMLNLACDMIMFTYSYIFLCSCRWLINCLTVCILNGTCKQTGIVTQLFTEHIIALLMLFYVVVVCVCVWYDPCTLVKPFHLHLPRGNGSVTVRSVGGN